MGFEYLVQSFGCEGAAQSEGLEGGGETFQVGRSSGWLLTTSFDHYPRSINGWCTTWWPTTEVLDEIQAGGRFGCPTCDKILRRIGSFGWDFEDGVN